MAGNTRGGSIRSLALRLSLFTALWLLLTEGAAGAVWLGLPVIAVALYASVRLVPVVGLRPLGLLRFVPLFVWRSLGGAWDVALRALRPGRPLAPGLARYETTLPDGLPRIFFANVISLLPGTLCADVEGSTLQVHLLDDSPGALASLASLEDGIAGLFVSDGEHR